MRNTESTPVVFRLRDSGSGGVWRSVAQVPEYVAEEDAPADDFVQRLSRQLWDAPTVRIKRLKEAAGLARPEELNKAAGAAWDLAVAFAIHALAMVSGPGRARAESRCIDALEAAISAGHEPPTPRHPDFISVAANPRFLALAKPNLRRPA